MALLKEIITESESHIVTQQKGFKKIIPQVELVLSKHSKILTSKEKNVLEKYLKFITNKLSSLDNSTADEAKTIVKYLSRV